MEEGKRKRRFIPRIPRVSLIVQIAVFFLCGLLITGSVSYAILNRQYRETVREQKEKVAVNVLLDIYNGIVKYKAYDWLIDYWRRKKGTLSVEYVPSYFGSDRSTAKKAAWIKQKYPEQTLEGISESMLENVFDEQDQQLYAEVLYNYFSTDFDDALEIYEMENVSLIVVDPDCKEAFYLFGGCSRGEYLHREDNDGRRIHLGDPVDLTEEMGEDIRAALDSENESVYMSTKGGYVSFYIPFLHFNDGSIAMLCESFDLDTYLAKVKTDTRNGLISILLFQMLLTGICLILLVFFVIRPIRKTRNALRRYTDDKDCESVLAQLRRIRSRNEIGELKDDLSDMIYEMDQYMKEIRVKTAEKERIGTELAVAKKIQADMLPKDFPAFPDREDFDVYASMTPAKEMAGDFYDFFLVDEDHLMLVIGDVSGKGVPAALFMVIARTLLRNRSMLGGSPSEILEDVNRQLCDGNDSGFFVTVWLAIVDLATGKGIAANAGHEHPALRRTGEAFELVKYRHSPAVGTMDEIPFREHEFQLYPGDRIYVYTDGVTEATDSRKELFGETHLLEALNREADGTLQELLQNVKAGIDSFVGKAEQFDDITMLAFDYKGKQL